MKWTNSNPPVFTHKDHKGYVHARLNGEHCMYDSEIGAWRVVEPTWKKVLNYVLRLPKRTLLWIARRLP